MDKIRLNHKGQTEHFCECCKRWKTGMFHKTIKHEYWRCHDCFVDGKYKIQLSIFEEN